MSIASMKLQNLHLLYDHQVFGQKYGGASRYYYELISRFCQMNEIKVALFLGAHINEYGLENYRDKYDRFWGLKHHPVPKLARLFSIFNQMSFNLFYDKQRQYIYHPTYYGYYARKLNCKRVITVYDMIHELYPQQFSRHDPTARDKEKIVQNSDAVICISQSTKHDLMLYYKVPEERIRVIYLGNSLKLEVKSPSIVNAPYVLYVGLRNGYKNFNLLLAAYAHSEKINRDFKLVCFGGGQFTSHERSLIRSMNLGDKVINYSGRDEKLANLYKYASVFIYPSLHEGFGIPPLEAMGYGCPVLASNTSSVPEVVGQAGLYFNPTSVDDLTFHLDKILREDMLRKDLIQRGYEQENKFSWDRCAKETLKLYSQI